MLCPPKCVYAYEKVRQRTLPSTLFSVLLNSTLKWYFHRIVKLSDAIVCVSEAQKKLIVANYTDLLSKVSTIYNPLPDYMPVSIKGHDYGYFGGLNYLKGFHVLLKAVAHITQLKQRSFKIHVTKSGNLNEELHSKLKRLGIFTYKKLRTDEYYELYSQIETVIVPSVWMEPLPYVVTEALINRRILIASRVGGIPEQVAGCKGTFLFDAGDYKQLAEKIYA